MTEKKDTANKNFPVTKDNLSLFTNYRFKNIFVPDFNFHSNKYFGKIPLSLSDPFIQMKQNISFGFNVLSEARKRRSLGKFGEILGYVNFGAAVGLAAYHFYKYGWDGNKGRKKGKNKD